MLSRVEGLGVGVKVPELVSLPPASPLGSTLPGQGRLFLGNLSQLHCSFYRVTLPLEQSWLPVLRAGDGPWGGESLGPALVLGKNQPQKFGRSPSFEASAHTVIPAFRPPRECSFSPEASL